MNNYLATVEPQSLVWFNFIVNRYSLDSFIYKVKPVASGN